MFLRAVRKQPSKKQCNRVLVTKADRLRQGWHVSLSAGQGGANTSNAATHTPVATSELRSKLVSVRVRE